MKKIAMLAAMLAASACCAPALAYESGGFVRLEAGNSEFEVDGDAGSADADDTGFAFRGGYYFNPFFAVEGFYARYGEDDSDGAEVTIDGFGAGVLGKYNFGANYDGFYFSGRAGIARINADIGVDGLGSADAGDTVPYVGIGIGYDFTYNFGVDLNYNYAKPKYETSGLEVDVKVTSVTLGLEYRF